MKDLTNLEPIDYLRIPWRRRWYFLAATVLVIAGVSIFAWLRQDLYRSETRIIVESATVLDDPLSPTATRDRTEERVNAIRQQLESRTNLQRIVEEFQLRANDTSIPMEDAIKAIRNNLEVAKASGGTFSMAYYGPDPQSAQKVTRGLADLLIQKNQASQQTRAAKKDQFVEEELRKAKGELDRLDAGIKKFKKENPDALPEQSAATINALNGLRGQVMAVENILDRARDQKRMLEFRLQEQKRLSELARSLLPKSKPAVVDPKEKPVPSPLEVQLAAKRTQLAEMTARYTPKHPDVVRLSKEVEDLELQASAQRGSRPGDAGSAGLTPLGPTDTKPPADAPDAQAGAQISLSAEAEIAQARYELDAVTKTIERREKERDEIQKRIDAREQLLKLAPSLEQSLQSLIRDYETKRQQVEALEKRKFNAGMAASASKTKDDTYILQDEASLPERPVFPAQKHILWMGIAAGLIAGFAAAFMREYFEPSLASEQEAAMVLKLPVLVSVPEIPMTKRKALLR